MIFAPVIGLEIHVQLKTKTKMFCGCSNRGEFEPPNTTVCPICMGHPGTLPVLNGAALRLGIKAAKAIGCGIPDRAVFDRKNYFYPDLPKGYQISQYPLPIGVNGSMDVAARSIGIERLHLEEDAAKLIHVNDYSLVDFNRAGTPLAEIVTRPDFKTPEEAKLFLQELRAIMRSQGVSDADMEKGHLRCDANISLRRLNDDGSPLDVALNPKVEVKNLNSFKSVERALGYEIIRQTKLYETNTPPAVSSTRLWDDAKGVTVEMRSKEAAHDYRYFPEPDLPPLDLVVLRDEIAIDELPASRRRRFADEYGFAPADARTLVDDGALADYAEAVISELKAWLATLPEAEGTADEIYDRHKGKLSRLVSGWLLSKLGGLLAEQGMTIADAGIGAENFAEFITLVYGNKLSSAAAQTVLAEMLGTNKDPSQIMEDKNLGQVENADELAPIVARVIEHNPDIVADVRAGKTKAIKSLVGIVMKETEGRANPQLAERMLKDSLS